jgi:ERCC4-related helicase
MLLLIETPKLIELRTLIENKIQNPINPENRKVVVFTAFADTARYLYENLADYFANKRHLFRSCNG